MKVDRFPRRHPLCTCPPVTFANLDVNRTQCAGGSIAHPVVTAGDMRALLANFKEHS